MDVKSKLHLLEIKQTIQLEVVMRIFAALVLFSTNIFCANFIFASGVLLEENANFLTFALRLPPNDFLDRTLTSGPTFEELSGYEVVRFPKIKNKEAVFQSRLEDPERSTYPLNTENKRKNVHILPFNRPNAHVVDLGMNGVPVLNQKDQGTCATFASTALLDSYIGQGDYIDQQCALELFPLDEHNYTLNFIDESLHGNYWNGVFSPIATLKPLLNRGVVQKGNCFGVQYPNPKASLQSLEQYQSVADKKSVDNLNVKELADYNYLSLKNASTGLN